MKYFVNLIMACALICAACFTSCEDGLKGDDKNVQAVTPTQATVYIQESQTATIAATVTPTGADQKITWTSADPNVVELTDRGNIDGTSATSAKGVGLGSTTVTATSVSDPDKKATVEVTVVPFIERITTNIDTIILILGSVETVTVEAAVVPENAIQTLSWTSSNSKVATVTDGVIRAAGTGIATVTAASTFDPTKTATIEVEVVSLVNKDIHTATKYRSGLIVDWTNMGGDLVEFFYTNKTGQQVSSIHTIAFKSHPYLDSYLGVSSYIPDFDSGPLSYRTLYLSRGGRDTLQSPLTNFTGSIYSSDKLDLTGWTAESRNGTHGWGEYGGEAYRAFDGDLNTGWHSKTGTPLPQCLVVDMKESISIHHIVLWHLPNGLANNWIYFITIEVYLSDTPVVPDVYQSSWGTPAAVYVWPGGFDGITIELNPNSRGRYLILYFPNSKSNTYISFAEMEVYDS
jgi:hypothetical protein